MSIYSTFPPLEVSDIKVIFEPSKAGLDSEFSFCLTGCSTK